MKGSRYALKITKIINNNVVSSIDEQGREVVIMGRGIGFQRVPDDEIDQKKVEKIFLIQGKDNRKQFQALVEKIPYEHIKTANKIISYAKFSLNKKLSDTIYIALTDHISFAIERKKQGMEFHNALLWEIKRFYNHEFLIGKEALSIIKEQLEVELPEDEAGFIALHIVNAELDTDMQHSIQMTQIIQDVLNIVRYHFHIELDEKTLAYERFLTHLKFFVQRAICNQYYQTDDLEFCELIKRKYPEAYCCAEKIRNYMESKVDYRLTEEEIVYLTVHIKRIIDEQE